MPGTVVQSLRAAKGSEKVRPQFVDGSRDLIVFTARTSMLGGGACRGSKVEDVSTHKLPQQGVQVVLQQLVPFTETDVSEPPRAGVRRCIVDELGRPVQQVSQFADSRSVLTVPSDEGECL